LTGTLRLNLRTSLHEQAEAPDENQTNRQLCRWGVELTPGLAINGTTD